MTVKELIQCLIKMPEDAEVVFLEPGDSDTQNIAAVTTKDERVILVGEKGW